MQGIHPAGINPGATKPAQAPGPSSVLGAKNPLAAAKAGLSPKQIARSEFLEQFEKIKSKDVREELESIFDKIASQTEKIGEKMYLKDILEYKKLVKEFLQVATSNAHAFSHKEFLDRRGRHRSYSLVRTVDRQLDTLTRDFVRGQIDHMGVLKKIDDIRGLLLDIMM